MATRTPTLVPDCCRDAGYSTTPHSYAGQGIRSDTEINSRLKLKIVHDVDYDVRVVVSKFFYRLKSEEDPPRGSSNIILYTEYLNSFATKNDWNFNDARNILCVSG
ncbi:hypothetical protein AVEN_139063-1 [Araneus ventricosus]|uniref:Uncharacterized protein n=1 Tax=Araneus ventricosus TaxID=182803 RepID=A0A4Y2LM00_ARAVE|nr:hypothetical protein AVEN_139063-1 [Araneus ventricosus]